MCEAWCGLPPNVSMPVQVAGRGLQHGSATSGSRVYDGGVLDTETLGRRLAVRTVVAKKHTRSIKAKRKKQPLLPSALSATGSNHSFEGVR